jgi:multidrug efflux pump
MNISSPFIRRPVATSLLAAALLLAGAAAYKQLPVAPMPRVDLPTISVSASLPGASPETMASAVATPLERRFGRIAGITEITSTSSLGATSLTLQFDLDRDVDAAARDVQAAINASMGDLPPNLPTRPNWRKSNPADQPILIVSLTSKTLPLGQVFDQANTVLAQKISQVPGVGQVFVGGGQQPAVRVQADPEALAGMGLTLEDLRTALANATSNSPKGGLNGPHSLRSIADNDQLQHAADYKPIIVAYRNGAPVRLTDVADVMDDVENNRAAAWTDGERSVLLIIRRQPGANIIEVIDRVKQLLPSLAESISPSIDVKVALDRSQTIRASVDDVQRSLAISVLLVILVVFVFLRSVWATAIPSVVVPLSLVATFGGMWLFGYSLDNLSLMALTISTGFVVDDAIVVTENVSRYIDLGETPFKAAIKGAQQVGFTIVSITVSLLAVFIPLLLMGGIVGKLFREFSVTLSIAVALSAIISLTLTPMMAARILRPAHEQKRGRLYRLSESVFDGMLHLYERGLNWGLRHRAIMLLLTLGAVVLTGGLLKAIPKGLFPQQDTGQISGSTLAPQDVSFPAMKNRQAMLNAPLLDDPAVNHITSFTGGGFGGRAGNQGNVFIELKPTSGRNEKSVDVINRLRPKLAKVDGISLFMQAVQDVNIGGRMGNAQYQYTLEDANLDELNTWAPRVLEKLKMLKEITDVSTDQQTAGLQLNVNIDRDTAARLGIQPRVIDNTLYDAFGQRQVATTYTQLNEYHVVLEVKPKYLEHPDALNKVYIDAGPGMSPVPLGSIATVTPSATSLSVNHQGQFPAITISFNLAPGASLGQAVDAINAAELEMGLPASVQASFQGTAQAFQASLSSEPLLIAAALLAVYIVLGVLYESFVHPITILSTIPSAGVGALVALMLFKLDFSIIALIGVILLIGIVKKNAIMMVDFAIELEREQGLSPVDAIRQACLLRFRPIMMTTAAALFGALPLALGHGNGAELRQPLGIAIVGGLIFSQMLTLFTTPVVYLSLDRFTRGRRQAIRPQHEEGQGGPLPPDTAEAV